MQLLKHATTTKGPSRLVRQFDEYTHLQVELNYTTLKMPFYWRLRDPSFCLVEIGVDPEIGELQRIVIPLYNGVLHPFRASLPTQSHRCEIGVPVFQKTFWTITPSSACFGATHDEIRRCSIELENDRLRVVLAADEIAYVVSTDEWLHLEFNETGELVSFCVTNLAPFEVRLLKENSK